MLTICTYNIRGFNSTKIKYISDLLHNYSIVMLQEHWMNNTQLENFANIFSGYCVHSISAMDSTRILRGRPHGGVLIIYPNSIGNNVKYLPTLSKRVCALSLQIDKITVYLFSVYMPCDTNESSNRNEYESILSEISTLCIKYCAEFVCIAGDMNTDLSRIDSWHTQTLLEFIDYENLYVPLDHMTANVKYSYSNSFFNTFSIIDHVFISKNLSQYIKQYYTLCDEVENQSDHAPVVLTLDIEMKKHAPNPYVYKDRRKWECANDNHINMYKVNLDNYLSCIDVPIDCMECNNVLCNDDKHATSIQHMHDALIAACIDASTTIPKTGMKSRNIPGWNAEISHEREIALFWRSIWINNNSPRDGIIADIMRRTRAKYHYSVRKLKNNNDIARKNAMAKSIAENNSRNLWTEIRKIRSKKSVISNCIDDSTNDEEIAGLFSCKYNKLYNSVRYEQDAMNEMYINNKCDVQKYCINDVENDLYSHTHVITVEHIRTAIHKLKSGKSDCIDGILSDNFKNGTPRLFTLISLLFTAMLTHGMAPAGLLLSTLVPIPKNKRGNKCDSNNYRQIPISSLLGKLFDLIILEEQYNSLSTDILQFGFKKKSSTVLCTSLLLETVEYYNENNTNCYLLLLDASKAFDRVEYVKLFTILREQKVCPIVLRLLMNMYVNQKIQVKWNNIISERSNISNGVKQGGCLSPTLFSIYLNGLIQDLRLSNIGCRYGNQYMGVYCYADDISLLSPSITGLREMLKICELYAEKHDIIFNAGESQLLSFNSRSMREKYEISIKMRNGQAIPCVNSCVHLGNEICTDYHNVLINNAIRDMNIRFNSLMADFSYCDSATLSILFKTYCMNVYGSQIWKYNDKALNKLYTCWRKTIRILYKIPYRTHNNLIHSIMKSYPIDIILEKRCIKYIWNLINTEQDMYKHIVKLSLYNMNSTIGENIRYFMYKFNIRESEWHSPLHVINKKVDLFVNRNVNIDVECTAAVIRELCELRDTHDTTLFERDGLIIDVLCTK